MRLALEKGNISKQKAATCLSSMATALSRKRTPCLLPLENEDRDSSQGRQNWIDLVNFHFSPAHQININCYQVTQLTSLLLKLITLTTLFMVRDGEFIQESSFEYLLCARCHQIAGDSKMKNRLISGTKIANRRLTQTASSVKTVSHG